MMKKGILFCLILLSGFGANAQIFDPVSWKYSARPAVTDEAVVSIKAVIEQGWHVYSQHIGEGGPIPTSFKFTPSEDYELIGKVEEKSKVEKLMDPNFGIEVAYFSNEEIFEQRIRLKKHAANDRQSGVWGKSVSVREDIGGCSSMK